MRGHRSPSPCTWGDTGGLGVSSRQKLPLTMEEIGVLTPPQLSRLRKAFLDSSGLSKAAFVAAMMQIIGPRALAPRDSNTSPELATAAALVDVFDAVDINHDGTVDTHEFCSFLRGQDISRSSKA